MNFYHTNRILVTFDIEKQLLILEDIYSDGSKDLFTHIELSRLKEMGIDTACHALGENLLIRLPGTREALFNQK